ncbi:hypothetical protein BKA66DRAFT_459120 [Pyrenochaeta sp. MPI-SDFR-AT-0127]|nr:hypothetical protein BKA66DRAFT_459120 [Pyrenochaeta sp. MPI-SDFR-AT-0127]
MSVPDNGPVIVGITWWLTFFCGSFLALRIYAKLSRKQRLWWDDHILIASWVLLLVEAILTQVGQSLGFGKRTVDIPVENLATIAIGTSIGASVSCFASTFSKISFGVTLLRLTTDRLRWFVWFCIITLFLVMIPSALNTWIQCSPLEKAWNSTIEGTCWPGYITVNYGIFNAAWCAAADFALALLPWKLIWGLRLGFREKIGIGIAMSMGVLSGVCAIVKGVYVIQLRQQDFYYNGIDVTIWTVVETATAIIAASIPVLRVFFKEAVSSYSNSRGRSNNQSGKTVPPSHQSRSQRSSHPRMSTFHGKGRGEDSGWTTFELMEDDGRDCASQRSILRDEEQGTGRDSAGIVIVEDGLILQTNTFTLTVEDDGISRHNGNS